MRSPTAPAPSRCSPAPASPAGADAVGGFGIYVHWPFCASKCPYCDFNSHVRAGGIDEDRFLRAYLAELRHWAGLVPGRVVTSVFFGGGTPSLMSGGTVGAILEAIAGTWGLADGAEVTLEANPSSVEAARFRDYRSAGVNRVSLGVQSLDDAQLRALGRLHTADEALAAIAVAAGTFARVSFDLIYARPGQTLQAWGDELARALALAPSHLSLYQLTIEQGTPFAALHAAGKLVVPEGELASALYQLTQEMTAAAGLPAYEISNHARPGEESRHNLTYWRYGEYAGIGPGAHGRILTGAGRLATVAERQPERWAGLVEAGGHGIAESTLLGAAEQADETLIMGLRLSEGLDLDRLQAISGLRPRAHAIDELVRLGFMERCGPARVAVLPERRIVLNEVVLRLASALEPPAMRSS